jgi:hypothetical protein
MYHGIVLAHFEVEGSCKAATTSRALVSFFGVIGRFARNVSSTTAFGVGDGKSGVFTNEASIVRLELVFAVILTGWRGDGSNRRGGEGLGRPHGRSGFISVHRSHFGDGRLVSLQMGLGLSVMHGGDGRLNLLEDWGEERVHLLLVAVGRDQSVEGVGDGFNLSGEGLVVEVPIEMVKAEGFRRDLGDDWDDWRVEG